MLTALLIPLALAAVVYAVTLLRAALARRSAPGLEAIALGAITNFFDTLGVGDLPAGSRAVVLRRDGYAPWSASVRVVANERIPIRATLKPLDQ